MRLQNASPTPMNSTPPWQQTRAELSVRDFGRFQQLIHNEAGIWLSAAKHPLVVSRLAKRLRSLQIGSFGDYFKLVESSPAERVTMLDCICTNETHFFREKRHFEYLSNHTLPELRAEADEGKRERSIRVWSAGCSTGEEPYSLAMFLLDRLGEENWNIEIVATDLSTKVLAKAKAGLWPIAKSAEIPDRLLKRFMLRGTGTNEGFMKAGPELQSIIRFERLNLNEETYAISGRFDLVFCCNVLIYFNPETKRQVLSRIISKLTPTGYLMLGHAESLSGSATELVSVMPTIYTANSSAKPNRASWREASLRANTWIGESRT
jgi:chemotaxis protein methyltransferase CheR